MQGMILAAGMGKRLKDLTQDNTKCMVKVNGVSLIERVLRQLDELNLSRIVIVTGYEGAKLVSYIDTLSINTEIVFIDNPIYDKTNNIYSLSLAKDYLVSEDTLLLESDLIFEDSVLTSLIEDPRDTLALVDKYESWMDGTCMKVSEDDTIEAFVPGTKFQFEDVDSYYKTVNIYKFSQEFSKNSYVPFLNAYIKALGENEYYEQVLKVITMLDNPGIKAKKLTGQLWYEIDDIQDLNIAESLFATDDEMVKSIAGRFGGYWRYPHITDFCYLVNPYYPPKKLVSEMKASFETLLTQYPSGMYINSLLAAKNFSVKQDHILVGNGAAELIKSLLGSLSGKLGIIRPSFEEYAHRYSEEEIVVFEAAAPNFSYTADDIMAYFADKDISNLVLINPDNPSGNYINTGDVERLASWCDESGIRFILDESFVDFADEIDATCIREDFFEKHHNAVVVKSISKSYGIPGLRLGVLASGDVELIKVLKKDVAIWNINSFAEFYMQIAEKYKKNYVSALDKFRTARNKMFDELTSISGITVIPSQANYFMIKLENISSVEITKKLLREQGFFIKDLSSKVKGGNYIRVAIRTEEENHQLVEALKQL